MGRSKIPITWIKSDASRQVTFNKRKKGMKKKAEELAILCGVDVCMICYGPAIGSSSSGGGGGGAGGGGGGGGGGAKITTSNSSSTASPSHSASTSCVPFSWGMPGVSSVISKFEGLPREERDKKKLDNTSLLEQQIKKLRRELKTKLDHNWKLEQERAFCAWDDRLDCYSIEELKRLADCLLDKLRTTLERISYWEAAAAAQQQQQHPQQQQQQQQQQQHEEQDSAADSAMVVQQQREQPAAAFLPFLPVNPFVLPSQQQQMNDLELGFAAAAAAAAFNMDDAAAATGGFLPSGGMWGNSSEAIVISTFPCRMSRNFHEIQQQQESWAAAAATAAPPPLMQSILLSNLSDPSAANSDGGDEEGEARANSFRIYGQ